MLEGALLPAVHLLLHTVLCDIILQCAQSLHFYCCFVLMGLLYKATPEVARKSC